MDKFALTVFVLLTLVAAVLGGSSRYDAIQLIVLQPAACLLAGAACYRIDLKMIASIKVPLLFLATLAAIMVFQLLPLPAEWWAKIPGRQDVSALSDMLRIAPMRPPSLVPWRTLNSLVNISVLLAGLLVFAVARGRCVEFSVAAIIILSLINAILGVLQILPGFNDFLYWYEYTNNGSPVGLFANRNHSAVFSAISMIIISAAIVSRGSVYKISGVTLALWMSYALVFLVALVNGSRAGLIATAVALAATAAIITLASQDEGRTKTAKGASKTALLLFGTVAVLIGSVFLAADRLPGFNRFINNDPLGDLRFVITPTLLQMAKDYLPLGSGFGSFEGAYYVYEEARFLTPSYVNQAHNDWLQFVIEAGVPGIILLLALFVWIGKAIINLGGKPRLRPVAVAAFAVVVVVSLSAYVDYPLRVPIFQLVCVWLIASLAVIRSRWTE